MKIELKQKQAELSAKYTPDHPLMAEINAQVASLNEKTAELNQSIKVTRPLRALRILI